MKYAERFYLKDISLRGEYLRRHREIWPEMEALIREAGIYDYTIWCSGTDLFACYESDDIERTIDVLKRSPVKKRWDESMQGLIHYGGREAPEQLELAFILR